MRLHAASHTYRFAGPVIPGAFRLANPPEAPKYPWLVTRDTLSRVLVNEAGFTGCGQVGGGVQLLSGLIWGDTSDQS